MTPPRSAWLCVLVWALACSDGPTRTSLTGGDDPGPQSDRVSVSIQDFSFQPAAINVKVGTEVTWTNTGAATHTTTSDTGAWDSGGISNAGGSGYGGAGGGSGGSFARKFNEVGQFEYHCSIHPSMRGSIVVSQ